MGDSGHDHIATNWLARASATVGSPLLTARYGRGKANGLLGAFDGLLRRTLRQLDLRLRFGHVVQPSNIAESPERGSSGSGVLASSFGVLEGEIHERQLIFQ